MPSGLWFPAKGGHTKQLMYHLFYFSLPLPFLAICGAMIALNGILGEVNPETIDKQTLIRVMQIRDFQKFSPDLVERLTYRAEQEFGRHSSNKPVFELPPLERRVHAYFQQHRPSRPLNMENNLMLMARVRYFQWMYEYQSAASARHKKTLMDEVIADMHYWQEVYFDYLRSLEAPEPALAELIQDFQRMLDHFKKGASPEEAALIDSFAQDMKLALTQRAIIDWLPPLRWSRE